MIGPQRLKNIGGILGTKMQMERFAIVQWEDMLSSIVNLDKVKFPRKPVTEYTEGDYVVALFGKQAYKARISEISDNKAILQGLQTKDGAYPLNYTYVDFNEDGEKRKTSVDKPEDISADAECRTVDKLNTPKCSSNDKTKLPSVDETQVLSFDKPKRPLFDKPNQPSSDKPKQPSLDKPKQPSVDKPKQPSVDKPKQPSVDKPKSPSVNNPEQPSVEKPGCRSTSDQQSVVSPKTATSSPSLNSYHSSSSSSSSSSSHSNKRRIDHLEKDLKALKKRIQNLEAASQSKQDLGKSSEPTTDLESALKSISHVLPNDINTVMNRVVKEIFSQEELITCNRRGKKTKYTGAEGPKPALDEQKLLFAEKVVLTKCPAVTKEMFVKKFDNILKVARRMKKSI